LITISGKIGNVGLYNHKDKAFIGGAVGIAKLIDEEQGEFIMYELESDEGQRQFTQTTKQSSHANITVETIRALKIMIPNSKDEQYKIADFFKNLDNLITLHQRKLELLKQTKQGYLQKMFPKAGESVPEFRFKGFTDAWEQRKLGELGSVAMNKRIFKDETTDSGDVPFYKIGTFGGEPDAYISRELFEEYKSKYPYPEVGDILISASGSIGRTVVYNGADEYFQDSNIVWLKHDERLDNKFLKQFYSTVKWHGLEGSAIKRLYNKNILDTGISVPSPKEQAKLGELFENLDNLITLHQRKLDLLREAKKAYLQKMFV
jgi:type I restriction enzyme S subunit